MSTPQRFYKIELSPHWNEVRAAVFSVSRAGIPIKPIIEVRRWRMQKGVEWRSFIDDYTQEWVLQWR